MIYRTYAPEFGRWAARQFGVDEATAQDAFQDAVVVAWDHARAGRLTELRSELKTYLFGIGRHRLLKVAAQRRREQPWPDDKAGDQPGPLPTPVQETELALAADPTRLNQLLGPPESACRRLLEGFYFERRSLTELAARLGYKTEAVARKKKCLCLRALRELVSRHHLTLDSFLRDAALDLPTTTDSADA